jgi:CRP/FNR family transcriptional regulator, cyclic AMP receptor protein
MPSLEIHGSFSASRLFKDIPKDVEQKLLAQSANIMLSKGRRLFEKGDDAETMYLVRSGRIEISLISETGKKVVFNQVGPMQCFGEIGLVDKQSRTASAVAMEASSLTPITHSDFFEAVRHCPRLAQNLLEILCERIRWVSKSVEEYAMHSLELRLARRLVVLHRNFSLTDGHIVISQSDLADFAGATREATNKILIAWRDEGLIQIGRRKVQLLNPDWFENLSKSEFEHNK